MNWTLLDFTLAGTLLGTTGVLIFFVVSKIKNKTYRVGAILAILVVFALVWAELSVGIFGTPFAGS